MTGLKRGCKRKIAAFLALCLLAASFQGTAVAAAVNGSSPPGDTVVISLSTEQIREAAAEAVAKNRRYNGGIEFFSVNSPRLTAQYQELLNGDSIFELDWNSDLNNASSSALPDESGLRIFICADETQLTAMEPQKKPFDKASASELKASASELRNRGSGRRASGSNLEELASGLRATDSELSEIKYEITGEEQLIFLFTNQAEHDLTYRLMVDKVLIQSVSVPAGESLRYGTASTLEAVWDNVTADTQNAPQTPEEEFERMGLFGEDGEGENKSPAERSKLLAPVFMRKPSQRRLLSLLGRGDTQDADGTAVLYLTTINTLSNPFDTSQFQVTLYDYQGAMLNTGSDDILQDGSLKVQALFPAPQNPAAAYIKVYDNVKLSGDFLTMDEHGYYSYQSSEAGARYQDGILTVQPDEEQFLPFGDSDSNQPFGMKLQFDFYLPEDGKINGNNTVFRFDGNEDVWIYLHDKRDGSNYLVLDMGSLPGSAEGEVDFTAGEIRYRSQEETIISSLYSRDKTIENYLAEHEGISLEQAQTKVDEIYSSFMNFDGSYGRDYQLHLYYLNRNGDRADCSIKFNLPVIPRNGVSLIKQVSGESEPISDDTVYQYRIIASSDRSELRKSYKGEESDLVTVYNVSLKAGFIRSLDFLEPNTYYYVEEIENPNAFANWNMVGGFTAGKTGSKTNIFKLDHNKGALLIYNTVFNGLNPEINKSAWKDESVTEHSEYEVALQVTGDSIAEVLGQQAGKIITLPNVVNPTVTDQLSDKVEPVNIGRSDAENEIMPIWLYDGKIDENGITQEIKKRSVRLAAVRNGEIITYSDNGREIASYSIPDAAITWSVAEQLTEHETRTLIYRVRVAGEFRENLFVEPDDNTGTHALPETKEKGYYANKSAILTFNGSLSKTFPHPVVRPQEPDGSLTIEKKVTDTNSSYEELEKKEAFEFTVTLKQLKVNRTYVREPGKAEAAERAVTDGAAELKFSLRDGESYRITGLNRDAEYTITESEYKDDRYLSELSSITVHKNGQFDTSGVNLARREATGTFTESGGTRTVYSYEESTGVGTDDQIQYSAPPVEDTEPGENGWYDDGVIIPDGDSRLYKQIGGTVIGQMGSGEQILTWKYSPEKTVTAGRGNISEIRLAQNTVEGWLREDGYTIDTRGDAEPYSVRGSRRGPLAATEVIKGNQWWIFGWTDINWEGRTPQNVERDYPTSQYIIEIEKTTISTGLISRDVTWTYSIYSRETAEVTAEASILPGQPFWQYQGISYSSAEALIEVLAGEGYKAWLDGSNIAYEKSVKKTNQELFNDGFRHRKYSLKEVAVPPSEEPLQIEAVFSNSFDARGSILVTKQTAAEAGMTTPENEIYTFEVQKYNEDTGRYEIFKDYRIAPEPDTTASKTEDGFTLTGAGKAELLFEPEEKQAKFRIKETGRGRADVTEWDGQPMGAEISGVVTVGSEVLCTNHYSNRSLTISKTLSQDSVTAPEPAKIFRYEVTLTDRSGTPLSTIGYDASSAGITVEGGALNVSENEISLTEGTLVFKMKAGGSLKLNRIPAGAVYTVKEVSMADETYARYYQYSIAETRQNESVLPGNPSSVNGRFGISTAADQTVEYQNHLSAATGQITVRKEIVNQKGSLVPDEANGETFILRIENKDPRSPGHGTVFYAALTIQNGAAEKTLKVPYGEAYAVTEEAHLRYRLYGTGEKTISTAAGQNKAVIQNCRTNGGYLSDSKTKVNTVNETGFLKEDQN